eukprot:TRINITY_DN16940_c0_g2_i1.p1 TRINITY_DN16940_c0_g2~~TRINITY_DN16940_c0_g2_i1.p1  ORF type:complete len:275 (-),score=82.33 TRINITY_DN16940_c0_g2_i1:83-844(-)
MASARGDAAAAAAGAAAGSPMSHADEGIVVVQEPVQELETIGGDAPEQPDRWQLVCGRVAAAVQRPMHYVLGSGSDSDETESALEVFRAPVTVTLPRWAVLMIAGLGVALLWEKERRIRQADRQHAGLVQLLVRVAEQSTVANQAMSEQVQAALRQSRESSFFGAALGMGMASAVLLLSDRRLKTDLKRLPGALGGCPLYTWRWSEEAREAFGLCGFSAGVLAQDVAENCPHAVQVGRDGYMRVAYCALLSDV